MSFSRLKLSVVIAALLAFAAACGSDEPSVVSTGTASGQPTSEVSQTQNDPTRRSLTGLLALIPDTEISRQHVLVDDLAARRNVLDVQLPGAETPGEELYKYTGGLIRFPRNQHLVPVTRDLGQLLSGFPESSPFDLVQKIGFDVRNADQSVHIRGDRSRFIELVLGRYTPDLTDQLIADCNNCVPVEHLTHEGTDYYTWAVGTQRGDFQYAPPVTDSTGEGGFFWFTDSMAVRALHQVDMEKIIERDARKTPSLLDDEDYALAASLLAQNSYIDATFSGQTLSVSDARKALREMIEYQGEYFKITDDVEAALLSPVLLLPYQLYASTAGFENGEFILTNVLIHDDDQTAQENAALLKERIENGTDMRDGRWTKMIDSYDIEVSGRAVIAKFQSSDSNVTFLRVGPTNQPWSLFLLYATLFTHEDAPEQTPGSSTGNGRFPTPTPVPTQGPSSAPGSQVGEQEPACLDRGGGGSYRDGYNRIYWLMDLPGPGTTDAQAVAQHLCFRGGSWVPDGRIVIRQADFLWSDLMKWRRNPVMWGEGVYALGTDVTRNRITVNVKTPYAAEQLAKKIAASEVPIEAVIIEVDKQVGLNDPPAEPIGEVGVELSVEFAPEVRLGDDVEFSVVLTNRSNRTLKIEHGSPPEVDIVVLTPEGRQVWRHTGGFSVGGGDSTRVRPGGTVRFPVTWSQLDGDGFAVPVGRYMIRGFAWFHHDNESYFRESSLSTAPQSIQLVSN